MGRFIHEAVAVDPETHIVYLTEDGPETAGLYRYIPTRRTQLGAGGKLQMLAIAAQKNYDTRTGQTVRQSLPVTWVDIPEPDPPSAELNPRAVQQQGFEKGAAIFTRLEGIWYDRGSIFFTSTDGGDRKLGQVWEYRIRAGGRRRPAARTRPELPASLELVFESPSATVLDMPDNICVSARGALVICEDGTTDQFVRGLTRDGNVFDIARNIIPGHEAREFAGVTFSPDQKTLFVNNFRPGMTFAIWGPWEKGGL
jgi:secreted PhoX family phosphatase